MSSDNIFTTFTEQVRLQKNGNLNAQKSFQNETICPMNLLHHQVKAGEQVVVCQLSQR